MSVTALYDIELAPEAKGPLGLVRLRYKEAKGDRIVEVQEPIDRACIRKDRAGTSFPYRLASVACRLAELLRESPYARPCSLDRLGREAAALAKERAGVEAVSELAELIGALTSRS